MSSSIDSIIKEKDLTDYPGITSLESTEIIISQIKNNICKIYLDNGSKGTGFFCKIPIEKNNNENLMTVLITNNHLIDEKYLKKDSQITITINNNKIKYNLIIGKRIIYTSEKYDTTIIQIYEDKDDIHDFLELDYDIKEENYINLYIKKSIYILQYPNSERASVSYGIIQDIDSKEKFHIRHLCCTEKGSSGSPIMDLSNNKLIGIHKGTNKKYNYNE